MTVDLRATGVWPKQLPALSDEQRRVRDQFMSRWLNELPARYGLIENFNHGFPASRPAPGPTLEIGAGLGAHLDHEQPQEGYVAIDLRPELVERLRLSHPQVEAVVANVEDLPFEDGSFGRVIGIHVLEHLTNLPRALDEISRVLRSGGVFQCVIPCEGGLAYALARRISAQRLFEREFGMSYEWLIRSEHVNVPWEIVGELEKRFRISEKSYFPLRVPSVTLNLVIGISMTKP